MSSNSFDGAKVRQIFELTMAFYVFVIAHSSFVDISQYIVGVIKRLTYLQYFWHIVRLRDIFLSDLPKKVAQSTDEWLQA